jgi:hypothetical protein
MSKKAIIIASIVLAVVATTSFAVPTTLQNGVAGYTGQRNEVMVGTGWGGAGYNSWGSPMGNNHPAVMEDTSVQSLDWVARTLIRFEDIASFIPAGHTTVNSATLELEWVWQFQPSGTVYAYEALMPWTDDEDGGGTWWLNWGNGGDDAGYMGAQVGSFDPSDGSEGGAPLSFSLDTAMVESWISSPGTNYGIVLRFDDPANSTHCVWGGENDPGVGDHADDIPPKLILDTIPEPATMAILGLGGLMVLRRRRSA